MKIIASTTILVFSTLPAFAQDCPQTGEYAPNALHQAWMVDGWDTSEAEPSIGFAENMKGYYDLNDQNGAFYDEIKPGTIRLYDSGSKYGSSWADVQKSAKSIRHVVDGERYSGIDGDRAVSRLEFITRIDQIEGETIAFDGSSELSLTCVSGDWKIFHELHFAAITDPNEIEHLFDAPVQSE